MGLTNENKLLAQTLHPLEVKLLLAFAVQGAFTGSELEKQSKLEAAQVRTAVEWLKAKELIELKDSQTIVEAGLTDLGERYHATKIPEILILECLKSTGSLPIGQIAAKINEQAGAEVIMADEVQPALGNLKPMGCVSFIEGGQVKPESCPAGEKELQLKQNLIGQIFAQKTLVLEKCAKEQQDIIQQNTKKRGKAKGVFRIEESKINSYSLTKQGVMIRGILEELGMTGEETQELTPEMIADGSWRTRAFRKYNINLKPTRSIIGKIHPYREYMDYIKKRMISLGFEELIGPLVESEFWDMDALFMPQFHSAREIHDVYFVKEPKAASNIPEPFLSNVAKAHESGVAGSLHGWGYKFDKDKTKRLVMRSQTTALSARKLADNPKIPGKYFGMARCFRYDQVDASHAPDFFQLEGIVIDPQATFRSLLGLLKLFASEIAKAKEVKFLPAYFPFTEPSVEVHVKHPSLGWMELGGAGIFRPEVVLPLGIDCPVLAWGLGTDRMAMMALGINDIRQLFSQDLDFIREKRIAGVLN
ncbi:MAG: phenylalanine--tRNA ligase subunit alpha [Deltaproteobacteria bacterium]|nr:phenylalanine--tRNA ligase subunit alpha [Deltaproteobacteria bacterium]